MLEEADELAGRAFDAYLCGNRTCEIGLWRATGRVYRSPVELVEQLTRPPPGPRLVNGAGASRPAAPNG
jgi:hypothetical protein